MDGGRTSRRRRAALRTLLACAFAFAVAIPAHAQNDTLLPPGFFDNQPQIGTSNVAITANSLTYNADTHEVLADGRVEVNAQGYHITGDHLVFDQRAHTAHFVGQVVVHSPDGTVYRAPDMVLSAAMHDALMRQLTITTVEGGLITAGDGDFQNGRQTILNDATYSPCGECIDAKGHRIGWSAKAVRMVYNHQTSNVTLTQPSLYLLGIPVAWLPWLSLPDPTKRLNSFRMPTVDSSPQLGGKLSLPYFIAAGPDTDIILTPTLLSRQGLMMGGEWDQRFPNGAIRVRASGVYQLDPSAFADHNVGDTTWRGAFQAAGEFKPIPEWTVGWSYTAFSDANYFSDYRISDDKSSINQVYATKLSRNEFFDFRLQQFNVLGDVTQAAQDRQALALPNARYRNVLYLPDELGEVDLSASLLGVKRPADDNRGSFATNGVPYNFGYEETKVHGTVETDWQKQFITPGGFAVTPFLGLRADAAYYDGASALQPGAVDLLSATPIAAVDVRYPLIARDGTATHMLEPIAQLVYRASDTTNVGINNDNAQNFILEDTNLFSYNRFSGTDRQETGLRANVGAHYQVNFANGGWLDILGGQSFQLAGVNAFAQPDPTQVTTGEGMSSNASYVVLGAQGSLIPGMIAGGKLQLDPATMRVTRGGVGGDYRVGQYDLNMDYLYVAKNLDRGVLRDQQEVLGGVTVPVPYVDYWTATVHGGWDIAQNQWLEAGGGLHYNDGYLSYGGDVVATGPTNETPNDLRFTASLNLKGL